MKALPLFPIRIFYDGACSVCATEIEHYLRQDHGGKLLAIDISTPQFDYSSYGITLDEFMYELHVIDQKGEVYRGVYAFWAIWKAFPTISLYGFMGALVTAPVLNQVARLSYKVFARIRPYLPKRHNCTSGTCRIGKKL
jgi:predicted DCC family thiol-disulfide oxidoreductase YuxK